MRARAEADNAVRDLSYRHGVDTCPPTLGTRGRGQATCVGVVTRCCLLSGSQSVCGAEPEVVRPAEVAIWRRTCQSQEFSQKTCAKETFSEEWAWGLISALRTTVRPEGLGVSL